MARPMKLGLIQPDCRLGNVPYNLTQATVLCREACKQGANLLCLPELFNVGYHLDYLADKTGQLATCYFKQTVDCFAALAKETNSYIVCPIGEPSDNEGNIYNTALLFDPQGDIIGRYAKVHLWSQEKNYFQPGNQLPVFETEWGRIGILICYDIGFPEAARVMCLAGAELLLLPSAWCLQDKDMWDNNLPQRALENLFFIAGINAVLNQHELTLFGHSRVYSPRGHLLVDLGGQIGYQVIEIDLNDVSETRNQIAYLQDRRPELYQSISNHHQ